MKGKERRKLGGKEAGRKGKEAKKKPSLWRLCTLAGHTTPSNFNFPPLLNGANKNDLSWLLH